MKELKSVKAMKSLEGKLLQNSIKPTAMRLLVLKFLQQQNSAISLSDIERGLENSDRITLYRTLKTFEENSIVHSIMDGSGAIKYALCEDGCQCAFPQDIHLHFYCVECKHTFCLPKIKVPELAVPKNFTVNDVNVIANGICEACKN
jgi:Fur family ferric uptake transcriptional regulator